MVLRLWSRMGSFELRQNAFCIIIWLQIWGGKKWTVVVWVDIDCIDSQICILGHQEVALSESIRKCGHLQEVSHYGVCIEVSKAPAKSRKALINWIIRNTLAQGISKKKGECSKWRWEELWFFIFHFHINNSGSPDYQGRTFKLQEIVEYMIGTLSYRSIDLFTFFF